MIKREKVLKGLEHCTSSGGTYTPCNGCPYDDDAEEHCQSRLHEDALALLKEQEARVMMLDEARETLHTADFLYCEDKNDDTMPGGLMRCVRDINDYWDYWDLPNGEYLTPDCLDVGEDLASEYGKTFRFWTSRPSPEQMRDTPWGGDNDAD